MAAVGIDAQINRALLARVASLVLSSPSLPVAYPDVAFTPPENSGVRLPYVHVKLFRAPTNNISVGHDAINQLQGILQLDICYPQGSGAIEPARQQALAISHFKRGTRMTDGETTVAIDLAPIAMSPVEDLPYVRHPVSIRWHAFRAQS